MLRQQLWLFSCSMYLIWSGRNTAYNDHGESQPKHFVKPNGIRIGSERVVRKIKKMERGNVSCLAVFGA